MVILKFLILIPMLKCGAQQNSTTPTVVTTPVQEKFQALVTLLTDTCTWNLQDDSGSKVNVTQELRLTLTQQICQSLDCGDVDTLSETWAPPNSTCLSQCLQVDQTGLKNCSEVVTSGCKILTKVTCGHSKVRLAGGDHRCGGRVEVWEGKQWGAVCDDDWDLRDANVVCAQLGCGYAVMVTGQDGRFGPGKGSILLDNLNCTGWEKNLWECPGQRGTNDCGHKEDAGVVCSEFKEVRLTGGLDRCSGRVEIHRNGTWGTVCDTCFEKEEATMVCSMLNCGTAVKFAAFVPFFPHSNHTKWYFRCSDFTNLWRCEEYANPPFLCHDAKAAGLICSNSLGLPLPPTPVTMTMATSSDDALSMSTVLTLGEKSEWFPFSLSSEQLACVALSAALLIAIMTNAAICCRHKRQYEFLTQQKSRQLQGSAERQENVYREDIDLINVISSNISADHMDRSVEMSPAVPPYCPQSSIDSSISFDTDLDGSSSVELAHPLSTFRNSRKYSSLKAGVSHMNSLTEEACHPAEDKLHVGNYGTLVDKHYQPNRTSYAGTASVDSFDSSSTSSGECYENTGTASSVLPDSETPIYDQTDDHFFHDERNQTEDHRCFPSATFNHTFSQGVAMGNCSSGEDSPVYSPVSAEPPKDDGESDCDYDDVVSYMQ